MNIIRLLAPAASRRTDNPPRKSKQDIDLDIQLLTSGHVFIQPPNDPLWPYARSAGLHRDDEILLGGLDIFVNEGTGRIRCRSIRIGLRTRCRLYMGALRGWEEDIILERKAEVVQGDAQGIVLIEGIHRFEFTLLLPSTIAPYEKISNGEISHELYTELVGYPEPAQTTRISKPSHKSHRSAVRPSLTQTEPGTSNRDSLSTSSRNDTAPEYSMRVDLDEHSDPEWLIGNRDFTRLLHIFHNPDPAGGYSDLYIRREGKAEGLGDWAVRLSTDVFSVGAPVYARLSLSTLTSDTTIFAWRVSIRQKHTITSPRSASANDIPIRRFSTHDLFTHGTVPPPGIRYPKEYVGPLWRGSADEMQRQGFKDGGWALLPSDKIIRPSSLPGIITPIEVSHEFLVEVYFSIYGEDEYGRSMARTGPGGLRVLRITKPVIVPSCALLPSRLAAPRYAPMDSDAKCGTCGLASSDQFCNSCPPSVPHLRHDLPTGIKKGRFGVCAECEGRFAPILNPDDHEMCACMIDRSEIEVRMQRLAEREEQEGKMSAADREEMKRRNERGGTAVVLPECGE